MTRAYPRNWRKLPVIDRLNYFSKREGECLVWTGAVDKDGYGRLRVNGGPTRRINQIAWEIYNGQPVPPGMQVRHKCDNPPCFLRDHLTVGTNADNSRDRVVRHRSCRGEAFHSAKLTEKAVQAIRQRIAEGASLASLAREYGVHWHTIAKVRDRRTWWWLP